MKPDCSACYWSCAVRCCFCWFLRGVAKPAYAMTPATTPMRSTVWFQQAPMRTSR